MSSSRLCDSCNRYLLAFLQFEGEGRLRCVCLALICLSFALPLYSFHSYLLPLSFCYDFCRQCLVLTIIISCGCVLKKRKFKEKEREQEKRKKKKEKVEKRAKGPITESWGKYGIIKELDMWLVFSFRMFICSP